ncbi:MAG TPA: hypothetical protein VJG66_04985 [Patescibacteria group bacterium]|nr:hypothetical protein [Patescibacteria group bacterium]
MTNSRGWSLVEVLIVTTVAAVAGGLLINLMISSNRLFFDQSAHITQGLALNQTELELTELIKSSAGIAVQYPVSGTPQYTSNSNTLVIKLPSLSSAGDVIESVYDFAVVGPDNVNPAILRKQIFKDASSFRKTENKVLSTNLSNLTFNYLDSSNNATSPALAERIGFSIELATKSGFSEKMSSGSGTVNLKNL